VIDTVTISSRKVGINQPCFIIAEAGVNHNGDLGMAYRLVDAAVQSGVDAVKFQSFITEDLITPNAPKANYQVETTGQSDSQYKMLKALELSIEQQATLKKYCDDAGIIYICTPYEFISVDMLDSLDVAAYKVASTDTTNIPLLRHIAGKQRPVILSTGMSTLGEVERAVDVLQANGAEEKIVVLQCTSEYPTPIEQVNLRAMLTLQQAFNCPVGFSDHTAGIGASPWAVALGACVIEKHFTLDRTLPGPDHRASLEPVELQQMVNQIRDVEVALGDGVKRPMPCELPNKPKMQKSLVVQKDMAQGDLFTETVIACKRPGTGLSPYLFDEILNKKSTRSIRSGEILTFHDIEWDI
jgi:N-acetylneuraminate synthase